MTPEIKNEALHYCADCRQHCSQTISAIQQRDDLSEEMERCHRLLDAHYGESLETTSLDTLEDRLEQLLTEVRARKRTPGEQK